MEQRIFEIFIETIVSLKNKEEVENFIADILSSSEKTMLIKRLAIAIMLGKGYTYDAIDNTLKISRPTIMNVSYWLKNGKSGYQRAVKKIIDLLRDCYGENFIPDLDFIYYIHPFCDYSKICILAV